MNEIVNVCDEVALEDKITTQLLLLIGQKSTLNTRKRTNRMTSEANTKILVKKEKVVDDISKRRVATKSKVKTQKGKQQKTLTSPPITDFFVLEYCKGKYINRTRQ